jgi:hypothetical protein
VWALDLRAVVKLYRQKPAGKGDKVELDDAAWLDHTQRFAAKKMRRGGRISSSEWGKRVEDEKDGEEEENKKKNMKGKFQLHARPHDCVGYADHYGQSVSRSSWGDDRTKDVKCDNRGLVHHTAVYDIHKKLIFVYGGLYPFRKYSNEGALSTNQVLRFDMRGAESETDADVIAYSQKRANLTSGRTAPTIMQDAAWMSMPNGRMFVEEFALVDELDAVSINRVADDHDIWFLCESIARLVALSLARVPKENQLPACVAHHSAVYSQVRKKMYVFGGRIDSLKLGSASTFLFGGDYFGQKASQKLSGELWEYAEKDHYPIYFKRNWKMLSSGPVSGRRSHLSFILPNDKIFVMGGIGKKEGGIGEKETMSDAYMLDTTGSWELVSKTYCGPVGGASYHLVLCARSCCSARFTLTII